MLTTARGVAVSLTLVRAGSWSLTRQVDDLSFGLAVTKIRQSEDRGRTLQDPKSSQKCQVLKIEYSSKSEILRALVALIRHEIPSAWYRA